MAAPAVTITVSFECAAPRCICEFEYQPGLRARFTDCSRGLFERPCADEQTAELRVVADPDHRRAGRAHALELLRDTNHLIRPETPRDTVIAA